MICITFVRSFIYIRMLEQCIIMEHTQTLLPVYMVLSLAQSLLESILLSPSTQSNSAHCSHYALEPWAHKHGPVHEYRIVPILRSKNFQWFCIISCFVRYLRVCVFLLIDLVYILQICPSLTLIKYIQHSIDACNYDVKINLVDLLGTRKCVVFFVNVSVCHFLVLFRYLWL